MLEQIMDFNEQFVRKKSFDQFQTSKFPDKRMVILSCMDTRLVELLPKAMNFKNGDIKIIKNAGAIITHPFGSVMKSILVAIYELKADVIMVVGHYDCGMNNINSECMIDHMKEYGISDDVLNTLEHSGISLKKWLSGFDSIEKNVINSVSLIKKHPLVPKTIKVHGLIIDPNTGKLDIVVNGNEQSL